MAREKDGYRDALERIRSQASGELVTVKEAARIVYGDDTYASVRCITTLSGWITSGRGKRIPATVLAQGGGAASLAGLAACCLGGWAAMILREVATCAES